MDDFRASGTSDNIINEFQAHMETKYEVTSNKDGVFLGIHASEFEHNCTVFRRPAQLQNCFDKYIPDGPTIPLPKDVLTDQYIKNFDMDDSPYCNATEFRSLHGALQQVTDVRPDIGFPIAKISQRQCSPRVKDMEALLHIVHYLYATRSKGVVLRRGDRHTAAAFVTLRGYSDCSFACHGNGKSQYYVCFDLVDTSDHPDETVPFRQTDNTGMFYFRSFMAPTVDLSTCEGETGTLVEAAKDGILFRGVLQELHQQQFKPTPLYGDNDATIQLATKYSGRHKRVRYMLPKINWLMEQTKGQIFKMLRLGTRLLPPDVGTKLGRGTEFTQKTEKVMGYSSASYA